MRYKNFYNGIGKSEEDKKGFDDLVNCDIHSEVGSIKAGLAPAKDSGSTITEPVIMVQTSSETLMFSKSSGKIWKRASGGTYSLVHTNTSGTGHLGALEFRGARVYYATATKLGYYDAGGGTWNDEEETFSVGNTSYKPMTEQNDTLFIGDGYYIASVNSAYTFTANALDLPQQYKVSCLAPIVYDLLIGTFVGAWQVKAGLYRWDTYSPSWNTTEFIGGNGINNFLLGDNLIWIQAGTKGALYAYDGTNLYKKKIIRDVTTGVGEKLSVNFQDKALLAVGGKVYSIAQHDIDVPLSLSCEHTVSAGSSATINSMACSDSALYIAWTSGSTYGVDRLTSSSDRADALITTPKDEGFYSNVMVGYKSLPTGTSIGIETSVDGGDWTEQTPITDTINKRVYFDGGLGQVNFLKARITLTSSGTDTAVLKFISIE